MKIKKLTLSRYTRLELSGIETITAVFIQRMVLILGSNGSGKSSLITELSPLPANKDFYYKGGYKEILIEHNGNEYKLLSSFIEDKPKYYFIKDGENLNPGLTITVYKQLVLSEFNITEDIHAVMTGVMTLDRMGIAQRRQWFTKIPGVDYEYAVGYYKRLKERTKFLQTNLKELNSKLIKEKSKVVSDKEQKELLEKVEHLHTDLHRFLTLKSNKLVPVYNKNNLVQIRNRADHLLNKHGQVHHELFQISCGDLSVFDEEKLQEELRFNEKEIVVLDTKLANLATILNEKRHERDQLSTLNDGSTKTSTERIQALNAGIALIVDRMFDRDIEARYCYITQADKVDVDHLVSDITNNLSIFEYLTDNLESDPDFLINTKVLEDKKANKQVAEGYVNKLEKVIAELNAEIKHMEKHKEGGDTICPNCNHTWIKGFNAKKHENNLKKREQFITTKDEYNKDIDKVTFDIEHISSQLDVRQYWYNFSRNKPTFTPFLQDVAAVICRSPSTINRVVSTSLHDLKCLGEIYKIRDKIKEIEKDAELYNRDNGALFDRVVKEITQLKEKYADESAKRAAANSCIAHIQNILKKLKEFKLINESLLAFQSEMDGEKRKAGASLMDAYVNECVSYLKYEISTTQEQVTNNTIRLNAIASLEKEIKDIEIKYELMQKACVNLSPTTGLIARGLSSFLESFLGDMNTFIADIWTYPLELVVERIEDEELDLDFKFKVKANDKPSSPDVSSTSAGQREIIDLAFRIMSMRYLGLTDYPIFLDEFGISLDHTHRNRAMQAIDRMMLQSFHAQVFMVAHYSNASANIANGQIILLHKDNIVISSEAVVNKCIEIEYVSNKNNS